MKTPPAILTQTEAAAPDAPTVKVRRRPPIVAKVRQAAIGCGRYAIAPDEEVALWRARLKEIFATRSPLFVEASLAQLIAACRLPGEAIGSTVSVSAALELIASLEAETEAQAALAVHLACLHAAVVNVLSRIHSVGERNIVTMTAAAAKLERAFQLGLETYDRLKHGPRQIVRVERVDVHHGAQAIVGVVGRQAR